jgi:hypothetical protein
MPITSSAPFNIRMRFSVAIAMIALGIACATRQKNTITTRVVSFPDGALVQYNGTNAGRTPVKIVLPQNEHGFLSSKAEVRVIPNTYQTNLIAQTRVFDPETRYDPIPAQIMIDMTLPGTNSPSTQSVTPTQADESHPQFPGRIPYTERSKPTQAVGLDRWNPGKK